MNTFVVQRSGQDVTTTEALAPLAFSGYAHFTALQIREGGIRGLDLHLERLRLASVEMFGRALPEERLRSYLRLAVEAGPPDLSLIATVYASEGEFTPAGGATELEVLIRTSPAAAGPSGPLTLAAFEYERVLPAIKHVGEVGKTYFLRQAARQGFDDAAFIDRAGRLSEGTIWNLAFWDGDAVIWPQAEILLGTTMGILQRQLKRLGVRQRVEAKALTDLKKVSGAVVMNSWTPGVAVKQIGPVTLPAAPKFLALLHQAFRAEPLVTP